MPVHTSTYRYILVQKNYQKYVRVRTFSCLSRYKAVQGGTRRYKQNSIAVYGGTWFVLSRFMAVYGGTRLYIDWICAGGGGLAPADLVRF
jgi:hypothetical protein